MKKEYEYTMLSELVLDIPRRNYPVYPPEKCRLK
jgi:hypothetical protein